MKNIRFILVFLHTIIIVCATINLHPHLTRVTNASDHKKQISAILGYVINLICITIYHTASIIAVWFSRYDADIIRASGILLIGELLQVIALIIHYTLNKEQIGGGEGFFIIIFGLLLLTTILITFRLAEKTSKHQNNLMQLKLLADSVCGISMDNENEPTLILN
ncbi:unnamed protein product [Rotaria sp. Silwood2]|nr:unnamed protein product [Rotaria sp. Silwood2]CAF2631678.1 unnamed protein product [Rotaria sp. Silwood2]CAF2876282.1 unnamed protein product [Rotaria sp. Silwood2]CAF3045165.1 unnamed protein product [Rotaria sp. Silwood2]CAF3903338.1 unnamed protein product [Rotaria sp. Silwood2]